MKKHYLSIVCSLLTLFTFTVSAPVQAEAALQVPDSQVVSEHIETLDDGSYFLITITEDISSCDTRSTQTKSGSKCMTYYDADNNALWDFTVYGTFQFIPGSSAGCVSSSYSINIYDSSWENSYASASKSGNQAIGDATFKKKVLNITTNIEDVHLVLTCSAYGTLS
ncbi:MAG: hypothetical protein E7268_01940 [Lachnospiraceae bacterium]|nr:hypothetical protein [Lachnospiraceae bacterium]